MTDTMPWRLQIAMAAMQGDLAHGVGILTVEHAAQYFQLADEMLAVHEKTAKAARSEADIACMRSIIESFKLALPSEMRADPVVYCNLMRDAARQLERMLNDK